MSRSLSWIDPKDLSAALARAGVKNVRVGAESMSASAIATQLGSSGSGRLPSAFFDQSSTERLSRLGGGNRSARAPRSQPSKEARPAQPTPPTPTSQPPTLQAPAAEPPSAPATQAAEPVTTQDPAPAAKTEVAPTSNSMMAVGPMASDIHTKDIDVGKLLDFELDSDRLDDRIEAYMTWIQLCTQCHGIFIVDEEGLVLMEKGSDPDLVALSAYFLNFQDRIRSCLGSDQHGSIAIDLDGGHVLHVVQAETELGPHALGFTVSRPLKRDLTRHFHEKLPIVFSIEA